jgi:hypothetical protein
MLPVPSTEKASSSPQKSKKEAPIRRSTLSIMG